MLYVVTLICVSVELCPTTTNVNMFFYRFTRRSEEGWGRSVCANYCQYYLEYVFDVVSVVRSKHRFSVIVCYVRLAGSRWTGLYG